MSDSEPPVDPAAVRRKVARRVVPLIFLLYIVAYLDRANAGFAKPRMKDVLGFPEDVFGWAFGLFFAGYLLLEIPGALIVERWSARKWFARILITWGFFSMATALVSTPGQFYLARFLLGLAEAGFFPGVIVYFTHWFPRKDRARALAGMVLGIPFSLALGAQVSDWLLEARWFGLDGWQWVFLVEGMPAVLLGCAVPFLLTDRPRDAKWLTPAEREWLEQTLEEERRAAAGEVSLGQALKLPAVWLLAAGIFVANVGGYALVFWLPTAVQGFLRDAHGAVCAAVARHDSGITTLGLLRDARGTAFATTGFGWLSVVYVCGMAGVWLSGRSSDRTGERKWHCAVALLLTGAFLALSVIPGQPWPLTFAWLCLTGLCAWAWCSPFWVLPTQALTAGAAAVAVGVINICANVAGLVGSPVVGELRAAGYDDRTCLLLLAACYVGGAMILTRLRVPTARGPTNP
jgi:ACS family tartrate transporter-like MFS transporter